MPELPEVSEDFVADVTRFIEAMGLIVESVTAAGDAVVEQVARMQAAIDSLHGEDINIGVEGGDAGGAAGAAGLATLARDAQDATRQIIILKQATQDSGAGAAAAAAGFNAFGFGLRLTGNALHWIIAGSAEFLAVAIPASYALAAGLAVAAQGAQNVYEHFTALYAATESTYSAFGKTVGSVLGLGHALQTAQNAANPGVYEILGSVVNDAKASFSDFAQIGLQVVHMFDEFSARVTVDLQGALGGQLHDLLSGAVSDLQQFGQVLGNLGHALLNFASAMPGLAHYLLDIANGLSQVILWASHFGALITFGMALEETFRWGGLLVSLLARLTGQFGAMNAIAGQGAGFLTRFGAGILALAGGLAQGLTSLGSFIGRLSFLGQAGSAAASGLQTAGAAVEGFASALSPMMVVAGVAAAAAIAYVVYQAMSAKTATEEWIAKSQQMVAAASDLNVLPTIYNQLADTTVHLAGAQTALAQTSMFNRVQYAATSLAATDLASHMTGLVATADTVRTNLNTLGGAFHTSATGALALANAAGINLTVGLTRGSTGLKIAEQQITNLKTGLGAMAAPVGVIGADMEAVGIQSQLASSKVQTVNQALDQFVGTITSGMSQVAQFDQALRGLSSQSLEGFGAKSQQAWQTFDGAVQQGNSILDTFRTGMAEGMVSAGQYNKAILDVAGSLLPLAAHSKTATALVSALAQQAGLPATHSFKELADQLGVTGKAARDQLAAGMEQAVTKMSNLSAVARNLSATVSGQLDQAMAGAIVKASGLDQAYLKWATDVRSHAAAPTLAADLRAVNSAQSFVNTTMAKATTVMNDNSKAALNLGQNVAKVATSTGDATAKISAHVSALDNARNASDAMASKVANLSSNLTTNAGDTQQASAAAGQAATQMQHLGAMASTAQGDVGNVNNEVRTMTGLAGPASGQMSQLAGAIEHAGSMAAVATGEVQSLAGAINSLQSKTITITTNMVTTMSHRQHGGPVLAGMPYTVGEAGRELFVPSQSGIILPNPDTERFLGNPVGAGGGGTPAGTGGGPIHLHATIPVTAMVDGEVLFETQQQATLVYNVRNGNPQSGTMAPASAYS